MIAEKEFNSFSAFFADSAFQILNILLLVIPFEEFILPESIVATKAKGRLAKAVASSNK